MALVSFIRFYNPLTKSVTSYRHKELGELKDICWMGNPSTDHTLFLCPFPYLHSLLAS